MPLSMPSNDMLSKEQAWYTRMIYFQVYFSRKQRILWKMSSTYFRLIFMYRIISCRLFPRTRWSAKFKYTLVKFSSYFFIRNHLTPTCTCYCARPCILKDLRGSSLLETMLYLTIMILSKENIFPCYHHFLSSTWYIIKQENHF